MGIPRSQRRFRIIDHSDRGSQYASGDYTGLLKENGVQISMSRKGNPWDNSKAKSNLRSG